LNDGQEVIHNSKSIKSNRKHSISETLAEEGCVAKLVVNEGEYFEGDAIVYETNMMSSPEFAVVK
jgi:dihydroxy-acid dehydratase